MASFQESYKNNSANSSNKYNQLIKSLNPYFTPFTTQLEDGEVIEERTVGANITAVVNNIVENLQEFYATIYHDDNIKRRRFVINRYNLGIKGLDTDMKSGKILDKKIDITRPDKMPIQSLLFLPEQFVRYSHVNLPSTTIYDKTNLNHTSLSYWKFLKKNVSITSKVVYSLDEEMEYNSETFVKELTSISLNDGISDDDKYKKFLQVVVPRTRILFNMIKKYIKKVLT